MSLPSSTYDEIISLFESCTPAGVESALEQLDEAVLQSHLKGSTVQRINLVKRVLPYVQWPWVGGDEDEHGNGNGNGDGEGLVGGYGEGHDHDRDRKHYKLTHRRSLLPMSEAESRSIQKQCAAIVGELLISIDVPAWLRDRDHVVDQIVDTALDSASAMGMGMADSDSDSDSDAAVWTVLLLSITVLEIGRVRSHKANVLTDRIMDFFLHIHKDKDFENARVFRIVEYVVYARASQLSAKPLVAHFISSKEAIVPMICGIFAAFQLMVGNFEQFRTFFAIALLYVDLTEGVKCLSVGAVFRTRWIRYQEAVGTMTFLAPSLRLEGGYSSEQREADKLFMERWRGKGRATIEEAEAEISAGAGAAETE